MVALAVYFDDSWDPDCNILAVAGYVGAVEMWDTQFSPAWWEIINGAPHPIREFKAADCRQMTGEFSEKRGWTRAECDALTRDLVSVITERPTHNVFGLGAAMGVTNDELRSEELKAVLADVSFEELKIRALNFAHTWCASVAAFDALRISERYIGDDRVQIVFDEATGREWKVQKVFEVIRTFIRPEYSARVRTPHFAPSHEIAALQAADLLAHETYKEMKNRKELPPREPSKALQRLVEGRPHVAHYFDLPGLIRVIEEHKAGETRSVAWPPIYDVQAVQGIVRDVLYPERV